ncbi:MAG TPA: 3-deoxy-7-phosphoheptulonate synthase [Pyrinomonadaceae bacterium]|nr:3-deoxy-7-phosphoheptulonate synthase [Pyrinomonadaceae bacterium]
MIVNMTKHATNEEIEHVVARLKSLNCQSHVSRRAGRIVIGVPGGGGAAREIDALKDAPGVEAVQSPDQPFTLASRRVGYERSVVEVGGVRVGGGDVVVIAGPCSVESREQLLETARSVKASGATMLRGGAYKPRTSPYEFQGLGVEALKLLAEARAETGLPVVTEVISTEEVETVAEYADMLQVGARNMQNFALLRRLASTPRPVLLKRGPSATVKEWLLAAEYLLAGGNSEVILCERGIKTFETGMRNTLDLAAVALARELTHLPVIVDPSHATGQRRLVPAASRAAVAVGADGLIIEVHPCPERALSDGPQSLDLQGFARLMSELTAPLPRLAVAVSKGEHGGRCEPTGNAIQEEVGELV